MKQNIQYTKDEKKLIDVIHEFNTKTKIIGYEVLEIFQDDTKNYEYLYGCTCEALKQIDLTHIITHSLYLIELIIEIYSSLISFKYILNNINECEDIDCLDEFWYKIKSNFEYIEKHITKMATDRCIESIESDICNELEKRGVNASKFFTDIELLLENKFKKE